MQNIFVPTGISYHIQKTYEYAMASSENLELNLLAVDGYPIQIKPNLISNIKTFREGK